MSSKLALVLVGLTVLLGALLWFAPWDSGPAVRNESALAPEEVLEHVVDTSAESARALSVAPVPTTPTDGREAVASVEEDSLASERSSADSFDVRLRAHFVDDFEMDLAGVELTCALPKLSGTSGADGEVLIEATVAEVHRGKLRILKAKLPGFFRRKLDVTLRPGAVIDLGTVELVSAGTISGFVREPDGLSAGGLEVVCTNRGPVHFTPATRSRPAGVLSSTSTNAQGHFVLNDVPVGDMRFWAGGEGWSWGFTDATVERGVETPIDIQVERLQAEDVIELLVVDPNGDPVPDAPISYHYRSEGRSGSGGTRSDEEGRCRYRLALIAPHDFAAQDPEHELRPAIARQVDPGTLGLVLQLGEARTLTLNAKDEAGAPIDEFSASVSYVATQLSLSGQRISSDPEASPGRVALILPTETFVVRVDAEGYQTAKVGPLDPETVGASIDVELRTLPGIRGRVVDRRGEPVGGAAVSLHPLVGEGDYVTINGFNCRSRQSASASGRSDEQGEFALTLRESGRFVLRVEASGLAPVETGPFDWTASVGARGLEVVVGAGGSLEGKVIPLPGQSAVGVIVGLSRGDGFGVTQRTDAKGSYRFDDLTPGRWLIEHRDEELSPNSINSSSGSTQEPVEIPWNCEVFDGATTRFDLDLTQRSPVVLTGSLKFDGKAAADWDASLKLGGQGPELSRDELDAQGAFELDHDQAGPHELWIQGWAPGSMMFFLRAELDLEFGENQWSRDFPTGTIEGDVALRHLGARPRISIDWNEEGVLFTGSISPSEDGSFEIEGCPAGSVRLTLRNEGIDDIVRTLDLRAGRVERVTFD